MTAAKAGIKSGIPIAIIGPYNALCTMMNTNTAIKRARNGLNMLKGARRTT